MSLELTLTELEYLEEALSEDPSCPAEPYKKVFLEGERLAELDSIDLNDCAGGACKL